LIVALLPPTIGLLAYLIAWIVMPEEPEPVSAPLAERAPNV
jgi:phage shock protein PspC (stress-responsive transcriptional regulator)